MTLMPIVKTNRKSEDELHALIEARIEKEVEARLKKRAHDNAIHAFETMPWDDENERNLYKMARIDPDK